MTLGMLFLEFQLHHYYLMHLTLDHEVLQQSKANVAELQNQPLVILSHGLDKTCCGIFLEQSHYMFFSCFMFSLTE